MKTLSRELWTADQKGSEEVPNYPEWAICPVPEYGYEAYYTRIGTSIVRQNVMGELINKALSNATHGSMDRNDIATPDWHEEHVIEMYRMSNMVSSPMDDMTRRAMRLPVPTRPVIYREYATAANLRQVAERLRSNLPTDVTR